MPENAMFYLDIRNGKAYFRGDIHAENGYFRGEVHATSGEFTGTLKAAILDGKLVGTKNGEVDLSDVDYIDLGGMILDGRPGSTGITFRPGYEPVKYQFGTALTGPWHDTMEINDKYRRDSLDGGTTWGSAYQFRGMDGHDGNPKKYLESIQVTEITQSGVKSALIQGARIEGAEILGGAFKDLTGTSSLTLATQSESSGQVFSDLVFQNDRREVLKVSDDITSSTIWLYGLPIVTTNLSTGKAKLSDDVIVHATFA